MDMQLNEPVDDRLRKIGNIVISRKGKDTGRWYVIVGISEDGRRAYLADGKKYTVRNPKAKNTIHLQPTGWSFDELTQSILTEKKMDAGRFQALLAGLDRNEQQEG
ncbi:hypothetical protein MASR2M79_05350 [Aminivibrio sp.]